MSARDVLVAGVVARLKGVGGMAVFDAPPVRGGVPYAVVGEPVLADWSGTGWQGREGRLVVTLADQGERPVRLRLLMEGVEEALDGMAADLGPDLGGGWRLLRFALGRGRLVKGGGDRWTASAEFEVRMARLQ